MTTTLPAVSLEAVGEALVRAHDAVQLQVDEDSVEDALVALCRASYDALLRWELDLNELEREPRPEPESWRTPLDELRLQAALAEMEMREHAPAPGALVGAVTGLVTTARRDIGKALDTLRGELRTSTAQGR